MFERFTDRARRVVVLSQAEARAFNHDHIGTEHLLLGLIHEGEGVAAQVLVSAGLTLEGIRDDVENIEGQGQRPSQGHIPFTSRAKLVVETALRESLQLGRNYIGTEHLLLALLRVSDDVVTTIFQRNGLESEALRHQVIQASHQSLGAVPCPPTLAGTKYNSDQIRRALGELLQASQALVADRYDTLHPATAGHGGSRVSDIYKHLQVPNLPRSACEKYAYELQAVVEALLTTGIESLRRHLYLRVAIQQFIQDTVAAFDQGLPGPD